MTKKMLERIRAGNERILGKTRDELISDKDKLQAARQGFFEALVFREENFKELRAKERLEKRKANVQRRERNPPEKVKAARDAKRAEHEAAYERNEQLGLHRKRRRRDSGWSSSGGSGVAVI